jgi:urease accessory protein
MPLDSARDTRDQQLFRLFQLFDSQFPVGAFAHSGGLETYGQAGAGLGELRELLRAQIELGWGRAELAAASLAWSAAARPAPSRALALLGTRISAHKVVPSIRDTSLRLGRRTLTLLERLYPGVFQTVVIEPTHHALVIGAGGQLLGLPLRELLVAYSHSMIASSIATATRCMPVSPAQGQELIVELQPALEAALSRAIDATEDDLFTCTPGLDIRCHQQGGLKTRLFQS